MKKAVCIFFPVMLIFGCRDENPRVDENKRPVQLTDLIESNEVPVDYSLFSDKVIITHLLESTVELYDHYEKTGQKNRYHDLMDFGGYCGLVLHQFDREGKIQRVEISKVKKQLLFIMPTDSILIDKDKIPLEQGLILFNGMEKPVYWQGNTTGGLDTFLVEFMGSNH